MCGAVMTGAQRATDADNPALLRAQIAGLERRVDDIEHGDVSLRQVKDESLWMCPMCQRIVSDVIADDGAALEQRIRGEIQQLARRLERLERRAG
jgi:hypothetical protein